MKNSQDTRTFFLGSEDIATLLMRKGMAACLGDMAQRVSADFLRWEAFEKTPRVASHTTEGVIELMPVTDRQTYAFKYVNGHPYNGRLGLPTVMAFGVLADVHTGMPEFLSELTLVTALRTAAVSVVAATALAKSDPKTMAVIGNGAQSEFQILAFHHLLGVQRFHVYDIDPAATRKLMDNMASVDVQIHAFSSASLAVQGVDIVTTITADKTNATIITPDMIEPGMHINAVGGDCPGKTELHPDVLRLARVFVEYEPQTRIEGDIQQMPPDFPVVELWGVLAGRQRGRDTEDEVTVFDSVGFALEDFSALHVMREAAQDLGIGQNISLVTTPHNPKNLFGFIKEASSYVHPDNKSITY